MSHNNGGVINFGKIFVSESKKSPLYDDEIGVGGFNNTPRLVKPLIIMSMLLESCKTSVMNPKP